jgi:CubicO group peptidase (beta-lactamase class C family)
MASGQLRQQVVAVARQAGYGPEEPLLVGVLKGDGSPLVVAQGSLAGAAMDVSAVVYAASLSKQITAVCAAMLVTRGVLDVESAISTWLPELPTWAAQVSVMDLLQHTGGLPSDEQIDAHLYDEGRDRTSKGVLGALSRQGSLRSPPGTIRVYSNTGYVCLGAIIERVAAMPLPAFAEELLFSPLGMSSTRFWSGPAPAPPGAWPLSPPHPAPLSLGDGGLWSTITDLLVWGHGLNTDRLGIGALLQTPGRLRDGTPVDYAWGAGIRSHNGYDVYRHGGGWSRLRAMLARIPALDLTVVMIALHDDSERRQDLTRGLLDLFTKT